MRGVVTTEDHLLDPFELGISLDFYVIFLELIGGYESLRFGQLVVSVA